MVTLNLFANVGEKIETIATQIVNSYKDEAKYITFLDFSRQF
jgi:hypothetical protein